MKGDFTTNQRLLWICVLAVAIGAICTVAAVLLLGLITFFTNVFYFQEFSLATHRPSENQLGWLSLFVPVIGALMVGLMARYGSEKIRGHGIPEAIEAILIGSSRMDPLVAALKPLSSAISIGSGGPFGAEGPIIMTGGACGSLIAQVFHLTAAERKTLLVAGAAGGMSAIFGTPVAAVLLAVELMLFEWKPRSLIPVALSAMVATTLRPYVLEGGPLFPVPPHAVLDDWTILAAFPVGLLVGGLALVVTLAVYKVEDTFERLPIHWMWWPAIGGLAIGIGGLIQPRALGVGYDVIHDLLEGKYVLWAILGLMVVKAIIWSVSLGSGTSGGVLAPLLIIGGAFGAVLSSVLPVGDARLWPLVAMAAMMGGAMRAPLMGTIFTLELTQDINALPALFAASITSYAFTVLLMPRSILTEKIARHGHHVTQEYGVDPLELVTVDDVMSKEVVTVPAALPVRKLLADYFMVRNARKHQAYPVVDGAGKLLGIVSRADLAEEWLTMDVAALEANGNGGTPLTALSDPIITYDLIARPPVTIYPSDTCRTAAERMAEEEIGRLPVVAEDDSGRVIGMVTRSDLMKPRASYLDDEQRRERFI